MNASKAYEGTNGDKDGGKWAIDETHNPGICFVCCVHEMSRLKLLLKLPLHFVSTSVSLRMRNTCPSVQFNVRHWHEYKDKYCLLSIR